MNPIAIERMRRERLEADIRFVDTERPEDRGLIGRLIDRFRARSTPGPATKEKP